MTALMQSGSICLVAIAFVSAVPAGAQGTESKTAAESTSELSVPPLVHIEYPEDRPTWLKNEPDLESKTHTWVVVTEPADTEDESADRLAIAQRAAVSEYISQLTGSPAVDFYPVNDKWIESQLVIDSYSGQLTEGDVPMFEQAVTLEFTPRTQQEIMAAWQNIQVRERLGSLGVLVFMGLITLIGSSSVLGLIGRRIERRPVQAAQ